MLQSELSEQKRNDVYNAYKESIAKFGDSARFVSKSTLFDEAMRMKAYQVKPREDWSFLFR